MMTLEDKDILNKARDIARKGGCLITTVQTGLYIEMKKEKGVVSVEQKEFGEFVKSQHFCFEVCYSWFEAVAVLKHYLN